MLRGRRIKNPQPTALGVHQLVLVGEVRVVELLLQVVHSVFVNDFNEFFGNRNRQIVENVQHPGLPESFQFSFNKTDCLWM